MKQKSSNGSPVAETTVPVPDWTQFPVLEEMNFASLVQEYKEAHDVETKAKKRKDEIKPDLLTAMALAEAKSVAYGELVVVRAEGHSNATISAALLMEHGVDADTIKACTVPGATYEYVQVRKATK